MRDSPAGGPADSSCEAPMANLAIALDRKPMPEIKRWDEFIQIHRRRAQPDE